MSTFTYHKTLPCGVGTHFRSFILKCRLASFSPQKSQIHLFIRYLLFNFPYCITLCAAVWTLVMMYNKIVAITRPVIIIVKTLIFECRKVASAVYAAELDMAIPLGFRYSRIPYCNAGISLIFLSSFPHSSLLIRLICISAHRCPAGHTCLLRDTGSCPC